ncbi:iron uptake system protein EfeO [Pseudonocardia xinjiangensis]|uniref:EfeM/EfeO family lipoprotein n=1 Tax=Pseudonocardia xinjiangensis TaxID=75289 RepID=A0ABX1RDG5_9PSEU|nr:iron uptake system protein EfeO [Pseudonocardia xinjiangensis]NMH78418.1 EfeM/EfeO family lipoprotein [Pseudonocardia xinjiangensis]
MSSTSFRPRLPGAVLAALSVGLLAAACGGSGGGAAAPGGPNAGVQVALSDGGCRPTPETVAAGPVTFTVTNSGTAKVTEAELQSNGRILGEKENITEGLNGDFSLRLDAGSYTVYCPGAAQDTWTFTVTGAAAPPTAPADTSLTKATQQYHDYVVSEVAALVPATKEFDDAVRAGDIPKAKSLYAPARTHYESIEPVAESFGNLDPDIDARINDVADPTKWTGFHRIEKALWADNSLAGMTPIANKLDADVATLQKNVATATYQPAQLANGASDLLDEVSTSKVTGEEDRYSHTDLWDFAANIAGARKAFELLQPALTAKDPQLAQQLEARFTDVTSGLAKYQQGNGYVDYSTVPPDQRRQLADAVNALAEPLSQVAGKVV